MRYASRARRTALRSIQPRRPLGRAATYTSARDPARPAGVACGFRTSVFAAPWTPDGAPVAVLLAVAAAVAPAAAVAVVAAVAVPGVAAAVPAESWPPGVDAVVVDAVVVVAADVV